jgi:type I restriction enzyme S subunit
MSKWKETKLADICNDISYGYTESASIEEIGPKFLRITDIANGRLIWDKVPYCPITDSNFNKYRLYPGDIIIARTGATTGANYTIKPNDPTNVVFASYLIRYKINEKVAYPYFIGQLLQSNIWNEYVDAIAGGSAQPGANAKELGSFDISLPPLPEQKAIAEVLSRLDDKIDLLHRQNETLEKMAETLFRKWFVEDADDSWEEKKLGEIGEIKAGGDKPKVYSDIKTANCNIPIYSNGISNEGLYGYTDTARIISESITISARGTIGFISLRQEPYFPIVRLISITPDENIVSSKYLYLWAKSQNISGTGTTQQQLTVPDISTRRITIPPLKLMNEFTQTVESFFSKKQFNKSQIQTLEKLRDTLLPKLISGEVRVEGV